MKISGTGMQKELLKCNDFFPPGQCHGHIFSPSDKASRIPLQPRTLDAEEFPAFRPTIEAHTFFIHTPKNFGDVPAKNFGKTLGTFLKTGKTLGTFLKT
jgi:hypothetical protein